MAYSNHDPDSPEFWQAQQKASDAYWDKMKKQNPQKSITSAYELWCYACDHFKAETRKKAMVHQLVKGGNLAGKLIPIPVDNPFTWQTFEVYLREKDVINSIAAYRTNKNGKYDDYQGVIRDIDNIIFSKNFNGAAVKEYDPGVITRQLNLANKEEVRVTPEQPLFDMSPKPAEKKEDTDDW